MPDDFDIPADYRYVDWEALERHVGKVILGTHVPSMTEKVAKYLDAQAKQLREAAHRLELAATAMRTGPGRSTM